MMKMLGKKSVASVLKGINDFFIVLFILVFLGALVVFGIRFSHSSYTLHDWPIDIDPSFSSQRVRPSSQNREVIEITAENVEITFHTERDWETVTYMSVGILVAFSWLFRFLWHVRQVLISMVRKNPFIRENALRFREIGLLVMLLPVLLGLRHVVTSWYLHSHFSFEAPPYNPIRYFVNHFDPGFIFLGFLILLLAEIFRIGTEYREDSHSIV